MSGFLLDTNVVSEMVRDRPAARVLRWIDTTHEDLLHLSVLSAGEIRAGTAALPLSRKRAAIEAWLDRDLAARFAGRLLPVAWEVAGRWGRLDAQARGRGRPLPVVDGLLAATALHHGLVFVTRNTRDLEVTGVPLLNPWEP